MDEELENSISIDDVNIPHSLRRSIWLIKDVEEENLDTADNILDNKTEDIIFNMRSTLTAAFKSGESKYVCPFCNQPVGLKVRTNEGDFFPFFSHYKDMDEYCPLKIRYEIDPTRIIVDAENKFKESILHHNMVEKMIEVLELSQSFKDVEFDKVINTPEVSGFRRPSIYSIFHEDKQICFDALVSNPQIGLIVGRNAFYKMQKMFYLWIFPAFSSHYQRMSEKDILYMNRRNVFVFDSADFYKDSVNAKFLDNVDIKSDHKYAYEESILQQRLMLNCYWQIPEVDKYGKVTIKWQGPELVAFDDIVLDENTYEAYFHDSDQDFYHTYSPDIQSIIDEWMRIKANRWRMIYDSIEKRKRLYEQTLANRERRERLAYYYPLLESGEIIPVSFQDDKTKLWGYKVKDDEIIPAAYYEAEPFYLGYAWVRKKEYWGIVDYKGNRVINFVYSDVERLSESTYKCKRKKHSEVIDYKGTVLGIYDFIENFVDGKAKAGKNGKWINYGGWNWNSPKDWRYEGKISFIDKKGNEIFNYEKLSNGLTVFFSSFEGKCGLMNDKNEFITGLDYDAIESFVKGKAKAKKDGKWGYINERGEALISFEYDTIEDFVNDWAKAQKNGRWGYINSKGDTMIPFEYDDVDEFVDGKAKAEKNYNWGYINKKGEEIYKYKPLSNGFLVYSSSFERKCGLMNDKNELVTGLCYDTIEDFVGDKAKAEKDGLWGYINENGKTLIPFNYNIIEAFVDGKARAKKNGNWGYIDENGKEIYNHRVLSNGLIVYETAFYYKNHCGLKNEQGEIITRLKYNTIEDFIDGKAKAQKKWKWGYINENGETVIPFEFDTIEEFIDGKARAQKKWKWSYIDEKGEEIFNQRPLSNGLIIYESVFQGKSGLLNESGEYITGLDYDTIGDFIDGRARAIKGHKMGCINEKGDTIIPFEYDDIEYSEGKYKLIKTRCGSRGRQKIVKVVDFAKNKGWTNISIIEPDRIYSAEIKGFHKIGMFVYIKDIGDTLVPAKQIELVGKTMGDFQKGAMISVRLLHIDEGKQQATFEIVEEI